MPAFQDTHRGVRQLEPIDTAVTVWIVDYDLPEGNKRRGFYRRIQNWLKEHRGEEKAAWSTYSVVITTDREFADLVYDTAVTLGRAHMYQAHPIK